MIFPQNIYVYEKTHKNGFPNNNIINVRDVCTKPNHECVEKL